MLQKTNIPGYMKDTKTHLVVNTADHELQQYLLARRKIFDLNTLNDKVAQMTTDIENLKDMLTKIIEKQVG